MRSFKGILSLILALMMIVACAHAEGADLQAADGERVTLLDRDGVTVCLTGAAGEGPGSVLLNAVAENQSGQAVRILYRGIANGWDMGGSVPLTENPLAPGVRSKANIQLLTEMVEVASFDELSDLKLTFEVQDEAGNVLFTQETGTVHFHAEASTPAGTPEATEAPAVREAPAEEPAPTEEPAPAEESTPAEEPTAANTLTVRGVFTGSFSEDREEASAQPGMLDCLVVFDCAAGDGAWQLPADPAGITLTVGNDTCDSVDTAANTCKYILYLQRYCAYGEPLGAEVPAGGTARMLGLFYVNPGDALQSGDVTLTVGDQSAVFPGSAVRDIQLPDEVLSVEPDPETAHRLADWRWRMDSIILFDTYCQKMYIDKVKLIPGDHFTFLSTAFNNLLKEDIRQGVSVASEPTGSFYKTRYNVLFDGGEYGLTDAEPPLDLNAVKRALPGQAALIQYLIDKTRAASKAMSSTGITDAAIDRLRLEVGAAYLDLCDAIGMPGLDVFFQKHPAAQHTDEFIHSLRDSGNHVSEADLIQAEVAANEALQGNKAIVKDVQQALNDAGFDCGAPDGAAGKKTIAAITAYQQANGLPATGTITFALLESLGL